MRSPICPIPLAGLLMFVSTPLASAAAGNPASPIQGQLDRPVLALDLTWEEAGKFCDDRVPKFPDIKSAAEWKPLAETLRRDVLDKIVFRGAEAKRWRNAKTQVDWLETIAGGPGYRIRKVRYEALPGLWIPALLYEPEKLSGKVPVHMAVNGHDKDGMAAPYKQLRCINLAKRGVISLNVEWFSFGQLRSDLTVSAGTMERPASEGFKHGAMNQLDLCGISGVAPHYLSMSRGLDLLLALPNADPERVAVSGLSGGGWQTIFISSLDTRVTLCNPVAGYSSLRTWVSIPGMLGDSEQAPNDLATVADYVHLTAMMAGRAALLTYNAKDNCCFQAGQTLEPLMQPAGQIFHLLGQTSRLRSHVNYDPGTHNYLQDNREAFYRFVGDMFFPGDKVWNGKEIPSEPEVKTAAELNVTMPAANADFNRLARAAMQALPREPKLADQNPSVARAKLREIVHLRDSTAEARKVGTEGGTSYWQVRVGKEWTVPVTEFVRGTSKGTTIVLADEGRRSLATAIERLLDAGQRVLAVDVYGFGEAKITRRRGRGDYGNILFAGVGERLLGVQSGQLAAVARWAAAEFKGGPAALAAIGPRTSFIALTTAAVEPAASGGLEARQAMNSLKEVIEKNLDVGAQPEQFCFGLLEAFDIPQLRSLADQARKSAAR